jgi:hypothetical protein
MSHLSLRFLQDYDSLAGKTPWRATPGHFVFPTQEEELLALDREVSHASKCTCDCVADP